MAVSEKSVYSPYIIHRNATMSAAELGIFEYIKICSDLATEEATISVTPIGESSKSVHLSSGDSLFGPFSSYQITAITDAATTVFIYERHRVFEEKSYLKTLVTTGYTEGTPDTFQIQNVPGKLGESLDVDTDFLNMVVTVNSGSAGAGTYTLDSAEITSISAAGLITFSSGTVFNSGFLATINYRLTLN